MKNSIKLFIFLFITNSLSCAYGIDRTPWYQDYFSMVTMPHMQSDADLGEIGSTAYRSSLLYGGWYGSWYVDWQKTTTFYEKTVKLTKKHFKRHVMYYDSGEIGEFLLFLGPDGKVEYDAWNVHEWKGKPKITAHWFGIDSFFKDKNPFPFHNYKDFGLEPFTTPDGKPPADIYEVLGRTGVEGKLGWNEPGMNEKITDEQAEAIGLLDISKKQFWGEHFWGKNGWITIRLMTQDYANPQLRDFQAWEIGHLTRELKPDGWHIDNLGDNNLYRPFQGAFGVWSEHTFKQFMKNNFSLWKLRSMGIDDIEKFDIKQYMRERKNNEAENIYEAYDEDKWKDDIIFKCYIINHALESAKFHKAKYNAIKQAAREAGIDCLVSGNLIPIFAGFTLINDYIDVCHFEWQAAREYQPTRRPMGFPPKARSGYIARLAAAISNTNYSFISLYVNHDLCGKEHENLYLAQGFEALANRSIIDFGHMYLDMYSPGTPRTAGIFNRFLDKHRKGLSRRDFVADIGVVYDQWAEIASSTACQLDVNDFFNEYAGWCDYFADTHRQWRVVLSSTIEFEKVKDLKIIVLPSAISLTDENYRILEKYLTNGGKILATGKTGLRYGPKGYLMKRPENPLDKFEKYLGFVRIKHQPAAKYWLNKDDNSSKEMDKILSYEPVLETDAEIHVGVNLSQSLPGEPKKLTLDLNNNNFDLKTDKFTATRPFHVSVLMPDDFNPPFKVKISEPEKEDVELKRENIVYDKSTRKLDIKIDSFEMYRLMQIISAGIEK